ncbi:MAG: hypothetical protein JNM93_10695 [Bacteriovoracaceae bacterium]|nr:hypothetical protein [Bacteriovoracaceae bacterium]
MGINSAFVIILLLAQNLSATESKKTITLEKQKEITEQIDKSVKNEGGEFNKIFKECAAKNENDVTKRNECIKKDFDAQLDSTDDEKLKKLSNGLGLHKFGLIQDNTSNNIRAYLSERLESALYGEEYVKNKKTKADALKATSNHKYVDHGVFYDLYADQLGKNLLVEVAAYCLENYDETNGTEVEYDAKKEVIDKISQKKLDTMLKDNQEDVQKNYTKCISSINKSCEKYREDLEKHNSILADDKQNLSGIDQISDEQFKQQGRLACKLVDRLKSYKVAIQKTEEAKAEFNKERGTGKDVGFASTTFYKSEYKNEGDSAVTKITTVSSKELAEFDAAKVKELAKSKDKTDFGNYKEIAEDLKNRCKAGNEEACKEFFNEDESESLDEQKIRYEADTVLRSRSLAAMDKDQLEKEALEKGIVTQAEWDKMKNDPDDVIKDKIRKIFEAEKLAVIRDFENKIKQISLDKNASNQGNQIDARADIYADKQERIRRIFQYSNVVNSYLQVCLEEGDKDKKTGVTGCNKFATNTEIAEKELKDGDSKYFENVKKFHETNRDPSGGKSDGQSIQYINFIDTILNPPK